MNTFKYIKNCIAGALGTMIVWKIADLMASSSLSLAYTIKILSVMALLYTVIPAPAWQYLARLGYNLTHKRELGGW